MLRVRLPSQSSVRKTYKSADGEKTSGHAVDRGRQAGHGITTESMDVNLFEKVHGKRVDLRQQAEDKNEREAQEKDVSHVRRTGQLARGGKSDAEQGELNGTCLIRAASSGGGVQDESKRGAESDKDDLISGRGACSAPLSISTPTATKGGTAPF